MTDSLLEIRDLNLSMTTFDGEAAVLKGIDLTVRRREIWGLVGETGSGKSLTGLSVSRLVPTPPGRYTAGRIRIADREVLSLSERQVRDLRGNTIGMVFQDPTTNLNPSFTIGRQLCDVALATSRRDPAILGLPPGAGRMARRSAARAHAIAMLEKVGITDAEKRIDQYPHQFSGGMRQRVLIAMALMGRPDLLIADEPTTALDVTIQAQILDLIRRMVDEFDMGVILITHNLGVVAQTCTHVAVMYHGRIVESGEVRQVLENPTHGYTRALLAAIPSRDVKRGELRGLAGMTFDAEGQPQAPAASAPATAVAPVRRAAAAGDAEPILEIDGVGKIFPARTGMFGKGMAVTALQDVTLSIRRGESFGLVGESGSGKTTLTRCILRLDEPTSGRIRFEGEDLATMSPAALRRLRARLQIVFQDPFASLNPRMTVHDLVTEPMVVHAGILGLDARQRSDRAAELLSLVGLQEHHLHRYPHEFSGGQRQRICVARALASGPSTILLDEPTSALDVSVQAQVLNLLIDLQDRLDLTYLFISHDLGVIRYICDRTAMIFRGRIVEEGKTADVFDAPRSDYAKTLLAAMPEVRFD